MVEGVPRGALRHVAKAMAGDSGRLAARASTLRGRTAANRYQSVTYRGGGLVAQSKDERLTCADVDGQAAARGSGTAAVPANRVTAHLVVPFRMPCRSLCVPASPPRVRRLSGLRQNPAPTSTFAFESHQGS